MGMKFSGKRSRELSVTEVSIPTEISEPFPTWLGGVKLQGMDGLG